MEARGHTGDHGDGGADGGVPQDHSSSMSLAFGEREVLSLQVFRVKGTLVSTSKREKQRREVTLVEHWLTQEYQFRGELLGEEA